MFLLMKASILLKGPVSLLPSVSALINILLHASLHVFYGAWTQVVIVYELVAHSYITMFLVWIRIRPRI